MNNKILQSIWYLSPFISLVFYNTYRKWCRFLRSSQWWTSEQLQQYQLDRLKDLLKQAYEYVPYYRKKFISHNIHPSDMRSVLDLQKFPLTRKENIRKNISLLKASNYPSLAFKRMVTGGTTGTPLPFYVEKGKWLGRHFAFNRVYMERAGYQGKDKVASFTGCEKKCCYHPLLHTLELSSFHMNPSDLKLYAKKIQSFQPAYITSYPSAATLFAKYLLNNGPLLSCIKAIFCHGEILYDWQQTLLENTFGCRVYDQYGHREQSVLATTCEKSKLYHIFPEYGFVEILDEEGNPVTKEDEQGEIVATSLHNNVFPFIRYKTGDLAVVTNKHCSCGRHYPLVKKIIGRKQEFLLTKDHYYLPLTGVYHVIAENSSHVRECQLYQDTEGELIVFLVKDDGFTEKDKSRILKAFQQKFDDVFDISIQYVNHIERMKGGKYQYLIQKLPISFSQ